MRTVHATDAEMQEMVKREGLEVLAPEHGTRPRVYYRNLSRFVSVFVGGSQLVDVVTQSDPVDADTEVVVMQALSGG